MLNDKLPIESIDIHRVAMPLIYPWRTAYGSDEVVETVFVRVAGGGLVGWGETTPLGKPHYSGEYTEGAYRVIRDFLAPAVIGKAFASAEDLLKAYGWVKGNPFAKAGLELAWWDLYAKSRNEPLWKLLGGVNRTFEVGDGLGVMDSIDMLLEAIEAKFRAGIRRVKLKFTRSWGLDMLSAVRRAFPQGAFHIDCNSSFTLDDLPMFRELDRFGLEMIEQPLAHDDLIDHAELQRQIDTPVCLDESISSPEKMRQAIQIKACRIVNIKPGRVGGLTPALAINRLCEDAGIGCWVGGMIESRLGEAFCVALATLGNMKFASDITPSDRFYRENLAMPPLALSGPSRMTASMTPGVGAEPDPDRLRKQTLENATLP